MNLEAFLALQQERLAKFEQYWKTKVEPDLTGEDATFWEYEANSWEWLEALEESGL